MTSERNSGAPQSQENAATTPKPIGNPAQPTASSLPAPTALRELLSLPGLVAITGYLLLLGGVMILGVAEGHYPPLFLLLAAALFTAIGGLLMLFRWGWAMALSAVFLLACYNAWIFSSTRQPAALIQGLLNLVFVLYLIRTEVREKLR